MDPKYRAWIDEHYPTYEHAYGKCADATVEMVKAFPELALACGFYHCPHWARRQHWWCLAPDGTRVDPTAVQFPSQGTGEYEKIEPEEFDERVPTGVCMDCGNDVYRGATFCSKKCEAATEAYLKTGIL